MWIPLEMGFEKRGAVVWTCIRLHNYCVNAGIEMKDELKRSIGWIQVVSGAQLHALFVNSNGVPVDQMKTECRYENCSVTVKATAKAKLSRLAKLQKKVRDKGLYRLYSMQNYKTIYYIHLILLHHQRLILLRNRSQNRQTTHIQIQYMLK